MLKYDCEYTYLISVFEIIVYGFFQGVSNDSLVPERFSNPVAYFCTKTFYIRSGYKTDTSDCFSVYLNAEILNVFFRLYHSEKNISIFLTIRIGETVTAVIPNILVIEILG